MNFRVTQETKKYHSVENTIRGLIAIIFFLMGNSIGAQVDSGAYRTYEQAQALMDQHAYQSALENFLEARKSFMESRNSEWVAYCNTGIGAVYECTSNYSSAYEHHQKAAALLTDLKHWEGLGKVSLRIGRVLWKMKRYDESNEAYKDVIRLTTTPRFHATSYNNMGINYRELTQFDSAIHYHNLALELNRELNRESRIAKALSNIGLIQHLTGDYDQAIAYYRQAEEIQISKNDTLSLFKLYNRLGETYMEIGSLQTAVDYLLKGKLIDFNDGEEIVKNRELLAEVNQLAATKALQEDVMLLDNKVSSNTKNILIAFLIILILAASTAIIYFRQQVINLNQELKSDDLVKQLHEAKLLFIQRCLALIRPQLDQVSEDVMANKRVDAVLNINDTKSLIDEIDGEISKN